ncbi:GerAB/ArcD/ProY family transporter [Paenibacillus piri]|uniref:Uncharacterized protein n=1 Tax=Paenibacillus piri TaxID=2547395 RepID=A0A4R5KQG6_9BACL|nr:endospore germination permease [Paenibacillus piri]TDF97971.1 hypothetical protein E1757_10655 [Paenibacillus piri]
MIESGKISNNQSAMLTVTSLTIMGHLIILTLVISQSRQDGWIAGIIGTLLGLLGIIGLTRLSQRFPGLTIVEILCLRFSWPGKIAAAIYLLYFWIMTVLAVRLFAETYKLIMVETPLPAFIVVIVLLCAYTVFLGLETIARMNQIMLPILVVTAMFVAFMTMGSKDYSNLLPIMSRGAAPVGLGALSVMGWLGEFAIMGMVLPYVQQPAKLLKVNVAAAFVNLIFFLGPITGPIATFGPLEAAKMTFPTFSEVRYIEIGEILNRFDAIAILFWTVGLMFRISIFYYGLCLGTAQMLKLTTYRYLVVPCGWLVGVGSLLFVRNHEEIRDFLFRVYVPLNILMGAAVPLMLLGLSILFIRKRA